jgi:MerR family transcriptional regulator, light-induced transcriptional regulator
LSRYSIKDIEKLTGIKAHTIRIWEQRYELVHPHRTDTNIRYYDDEQLKKMINISILIRNGKKISHISKLSDDAMKQATIQTLENQHAGEEFFQVQTDALLISMIELDEQHFEKIISTSTLRYGFENVMLKILIPFLHKVGLLWTSGEISISQEHFITNLIRRKLLVAIDGQVTNIRREEKFLLFLPENELHEIGLLFAKYLIRSRGYRIVYLGQSVPLQDVIQISGHYKPTFLLTYFTLGFGQQEVINNVKAISEKLPDTSLLICGPGVTYTDVSQYPTTRILYTVDELLNFLNNL